MQPPPEQPQKYVQVSTHTRKDSVFLGLMNALLKNKNSSKRSFFAIMLQVVLALLFRVLCQNDLFQQPD